MPAYTTVVTHATGDVFPATDWNTYLRDNLAFLHDQGAALASAATITPTNQYHRVTGTTTITAIAAPSGSGQGGNRLLLYFVSAGCAITAGGALVLTGGAFVSTAGSYIQFVWDTTASAWVEISRNPVSKVLLYQEFSSDVSINNITEAAPTDIVSAGAYTYSGNDPVRAEFYCAALRFTALGAINLWEDTTDRGRVVSSRAAVAQQHGGLWARRYIPAAGLKTLKYRGWAGNNSPGLVVGVGTGGVGVDMPGYIRVTLDA